MSNDTFGRQILLATWPNVIGGEPTLREVQVVQAVSRGEGGYGLATYRELDISPGPNYGSVVNSISNSNNWGAIQDPQCRSDSFVATDSSPSKHTADNPSGFYNTCFRSWPTPEAGCTAYLKTLLTGKRESVREAARTGSAQLVAEAMHATGYFEGFGATVAIRIGHYADAIDTNAAKIASNLGEQKVVTRGPPEGGFGGFGGSGDWGPVEYGAAGGIVAAGLYFLAKRRNARP